MRNYVFLFFLPGSAGNFFSRCLSLAGDEYYSWVDKNRTPHLTVDEKFQLFRYDDRSDKFDDWVEFEKTLHKHHNIIEHATLPNGSISIWHQHPTLNLLQKGIAGPDDKQLVVYIDSSREFEWALLNALWKDSYIDVRWLKDSVPLLNDPSVHKVPLESIIGSPESLVSEIETIVNNLGKELNDHSKKLISALWQEWYPTTLKKESFAEFKKQIGFFL